MKGKILVCIFSIDDEQAVLDDLNRMPPVVSANEHEILILIDGSREESFKETVKCIQDIEYLNVQILFTSENLGYGGNQKLAFHYAVKHEFDVVLMLDECGQYPTERLEELLSVLMTSDVQAVVSSRFLNNAQNPRRQMPLHRYLGNRLVTSLQNLILGLKYSEFHSGFRSFRVKALEKIPFPFNSNGRQFDTEILIQFKLKGFAVKEVPIFLNKETKSRILDHVRYGIDVLRVSINFQLHQRFLFYERKFDVSSGTEKYTLKVGYPSSHQLALNEVTGNGRVLDIGCGRSLVGAELKKTGCWVEAVDCEVPDGGAKINKFTKMDLNDENVSLLVHDFDYVLLLDVLEHLEEPEKFILNLRTHARGKSPKVLLSVPNIGFFIIRLQLLLGQFNYGTRGILDMGHRRLFTFKTIRKMLEDAGFKIMKCDGIPVPFPEAIGDNPVSRMLMAVNQLLIWFFPKIFSYQIFMVVSPLPTLDDLLISSRTPVKESSN
jgi:2-polyprenyl-3-methyl-5-hydroxy-6-metoxy-1,4-benzoquinol methylase